MFEWMSRYLVVCRHMSWICVAKGGFTIVQLSTGQYLTKLQTRGNSRNLARDVPLRPPSCNPILRRPHVLARSLPQTRPYHQSRRRTSVPTSRRGPVHERYVYVHNFLVLYTDRHVSSDLKAGKLARILRFRSPPSCPTILPPLS